MAYGSSKAALSNLTKSVAIYAMNKKYPIRCNMVVPSTILTSAWEPVLGDIKNPNKKVMNRITSGIPMRRFGIPEEVANAVFFLASKEASYITGSINFVDGGWTAYGYI